MHGKKPMRFGEMTQLAVCLPCKHEGLGLDPQDPTTKPSAGVCICNPALGVGVETYGSLELLSSQLSQISNSSQ